MESTNWQSEPSFVTTRKIFRCDLLILDSDSVNPRSGLGQFGSVLHFTLRVRVSVRGVNGMSFPFFESLPLAQCRR
jgi:hypothetical protein